MDDSIPLDASRKQCTCCKKPKLLTDFHLNKTMPDGLQAHCKECRKGEKYKPRVVDFEHKGKKRCSKCKEWLPATSEYFFRRNERKIGWYARCKKCRKEFNAPTPEKQQEYNRNHRETHIEQIRAYGVSEVAKQYQRDYNHAHPEPKKHYRKTHAFERKAYNHRRRARKQGNGGIYTQQDIQRQYSGQKGKCYYCRKKLIKYHIDHVIPLSRGGSNDPSNLVLACPSCNVRKHDRLPHEWPEGNRLL